MPSLDFSSAPPSGTLKIESAPPGAEARVSTGPTCRTPCSLPVPGTGEFTVSFALPGYLPQTIPVRALPPEFQFGAPATVRFDPSPVVAQLEPAPPPPPVKKRKKPAKTATTQKPAGQ